MKRIASAAVFIASLAAASTALAEKSDEQHNYCEEDADCALMETPCNGWMAVQKGAKNTLDQVAGMMSPYMKCPTPSANPAPKPVGAKCINNVCKPDTASKK